jgi:hypothetical protein
MDNYKTDKRNLADADLGRADRELMNKKGLSVEDVKGILTDETMTSGKNGGELTMMLAGLIFGVLLIGTGVFIALTTYYSIFGILAGVVLAIAGVAIAYFGFTKKPKQVIE